MKQKHDARAYFGKKFIVFDFLRNPARNWLKIGYEIVYEIVYEIRHGNRHENKSWDKIMNVCPLAVKQILGRL